MSQVKQQGPPPSTTDLIEHLNSFDGAPNEFLFNLLVVQCHLTSASCGAILRPGPDGNIDVPASFPPLDQNEPIPVWLAQAVESGEEAFRTGKTTVKPLQNPDDLYGAPAGRHLVLLPIKRSGRAVGLAAFVMENTDRASIEAGREKLELTVSLLSLYEMRLVLQNREMDLHRLQDAMGVLAAINTQDKFTGAAMALCNEIASRWSADRVGLGVLKGRYVHLKAMNHTEKFSRKMQLVQDIESAMEECLDQDIETFDPPEPDATYVSRASKNLSLKHGPTAVMCLPLRKAGEPQAVLSIERQREKPLEEQEIEALRLVGDLSTARLLHLHETDKWIGAKITSGARKGLAAVVGPKHTWIKLVAILVLAFAAFMIFAKGTYQADAPVVLQTTVARQIPAPFEGRLAEVYVKPGDDVTQGQVLAELDTTDLELQLLDAKTQQLTHLKQASAARRDNKTAEEQMALNQARRAEAQIDLLQYYIDRAKITAPIDGTVTQGDLRRHLDSPVKTGDVLFEVAPLEELRGELSVPEDEIAEVRVGMTGELAVASYPDQKIPFLVEHIFPVAEAVNQRNVFKVRVKLQDRRPWMHPGMEGLAKVDIAQRSYAWIWTHKIINWVRMKLWI